MINFEQLHLYQENNRIEAKQARGGLPHSIWETYSAFANTLGGIILLGVMELPDKSFQSVRLSSPQWLADEFWTLLNDSSHVNVNLLSRDDIRIEESEGNHIVVIEVPRADRRDRPVYVGSDPFSGSYRRNGEGDYRCSHEEVQSMLRDQADSTFDSRLLTELALSDLNTDSVIRYHAALSTLPSGDSLTGLDFPEFLCRLGAATQSPDGSIHPTAGGLLMFGRYEDICRHFPGYSLNYSEVRPSSADHSDGAAVGIDRPDEPTIQTNSFNGAPDGDPAPDCRLNLFDFYSYVKENFSHRLPDIPAVRHACSEALVNALTHADYQTTDRVGVSVVNTPTKLLITNPGSFRANLKEAVKGGVSDPRNALLSKLFGLLLSRPGRRRGLSAILTAWEDQGWSAPAIREEYSPERITLILPLKNSPADPLDLPIQTVFRRLPLSRELREQQIIELLTSQPNCTLNEFCDKLHLSGSHVRRLLHGLTEKGLITSVQTAKMKTYRLKS